MLQFLLFQVQFHFHLCQRQIHWVKIIFSLLRFYFPIKVQPTQCNFLKQYCDISQWGQPKEREILKKNVLKEWLKTWIYYLVSLIFVLWSLKYDNNHCCLLEYLSKYYCHTYNFCIHFITPQLSSLRHFQNQKTVNNFFGIGIWALSGWNNPGCCLHFCIFHKTFH